MKRLILALAFATATTAAMADYPLPAIPKSFQGAWANVEGGSMVVGRNTVSYGDPLRLLSIRPCSEELTCVDITWSAGMSKSEIYFRLIKVNGRQALITVNADQPSQSSLYFKR